MRTTQAPAYPAHADERAPALADGSSLDRRPFRPDGRRDAGVSRGGPGTSHPSDLAGGPRCRTLARRARARLGYRLSHVRCHWPRTPRAGGALLSRQDELHAEVAVARRPIAPMQALVTLVLVTQVRGQTMGGAR